jgi:hypothetical protein
MSTDPPLELEQDHRFPSGPWRGFFLMTHLPGRHWMDLELTFRQGALHGEGRDWIGAFLIRGRYQVEDGKCWWTKSYIKKHDVAYAGYNEGKGIWGTWDIRKESRGGFHIWPVAMGDPTGSTLSEEVEEPAPAEFEEVTATASPALAGRRRGEPS